MHAQWYRILSEKKIGGSPLLLGKRNRKKHEAVETVNVVFGKNEKEEDKIFTKYSANKNYHGFIKSKA